MADMKNLSLFFSVPALALLLLGCESAGVIQLPTAGSSADPAQSIPGPSHPPPQTDQPPATQPANPSPDPANPPQRQDPVDRGSGPFIPAPPMTVPVAIDCGNGNTTVKKSGPSGNRINLIVLGDGYTAAELTSSFPRHVQKLIDYMDTNSLAEPYNRYRKFINVCRLDIASNQSGVDIPDEGVSVDTAFDGQGSDRTRLGLVDETKVGTAMRSLLQGSGVDPDWVAVTLNTNRWFNSGGGLMVWAGATQNAEDVALHEGGHSFHALADEYAYGESGPFSGSEPAEVNVTADRAGVKWQHWLGFEQTNLGAIQIYEGARYHETNIWRPSKNSKMNQLPDYHNAVCREKMILDLYKTIRPVDGHTPNLSPLKNPMALSIQTVDPAVFSISWKVDGQTLADQSGESLPIEGLQLARGQHQVEVEVADETPWVRKDRDKLRQTITWTVDIL